MALLKFNIIADARGSVNGTTFSRNKAGAYMRNRTRPINPNSTRQQAVRAAMNNLAFDFQTFDRATVNSWNEIAATYPAFNKLGEEYIQSGKQLYISCGLNLAAIGSPNPVTLPSAEPEVPQCNIDGLTLDFQAAGGVIERLRIENVTSDLADAQIVYCVTPNLPAARGQSYRNRMRQMAAIVQGVDADLFSQFNATFGTPLVADGQVINIRVAATNPRNGLSSAWFYGFGEILNTP